MTPRRRHGSGPLLRLGLACAALLLWGFTCVNQDYAAVETLYLEGKFGSRFQSQVFAPYASRLTVDYVVQADANAPLDIELTATALQPEGGADATTLVADTSTPDAGDSDAGDTTTADGTGTSTVRVQLDRGERRVGRFDERVLLSGVGVELDAYCISTPCIGTVTYTVLLGQHECRSDSQCSSEEICDERIGRCTPRPCATNDECPQDQECSPDFGRCVQSGLLCAVAPGAPTSRPPALLLLFTFGAALLGLATRRRPRARRALLGAAAALFLLLAASAEASAQSTFDKPTVNLGFGVQTLLFTGDLADVSGTGLGLEYAQGLYYRYFGVQAALSTSYFLTFQEPPPVSRGLQLYTLRLSPTFLYPWRSFRAVGSVDLQRVGVISNALVRYTGPSLEFDAAGASLGVRWHLNPLILGLHARYAHFFEFSAGLWTFNLEFALETVL